METGFIYQNTYLAAKVYQDMKNGKKPEDTQAPAEDGIFLDKITEKVPVSPKDMTLEEYKEYFNEKVEALYTHPSQKDMNWFIDITDAAYRRMQADPAYEQKVLDLLAKNKAVNFGSYAPRFAYTHIDDTMEKCYGYTQGIRDEYRRARRLAAKRRDELEQQRKQRRKELLKKYLKKRAEEKELRRKLLEQHFKKKRLERDRQQRVWVNKRLLLKASNAYEANIMLEESAEEKARIAQMAEERSQQQDMLREV